MRIVSLLSLAVLATDLAAQSNTVPGLDGRLTVINNLTYYGRRGAAHPNGEIGMAMLNTMCNPGSVNIPWQQAMQPNHPKFGFIIARVHNDRIEQINEWSFCKHAFTSINVNGACGSCQNPNTGTLMGINCSDTYGASNNASRTWLGPPAEIDPWLGTWNPVGSYFDIGDPMQAGYPAPADGTRSLSQTIFDNVDNRVTVDEVDLTTVGASYYYALQLIHEGESLANRGDNLAHRGMNPTWNGNNWSFSNNAEGQQHGSVLTRWPGAVVESASNGLDDGRFFVASKVTTLGGGNYHYEYAVHNVDNSRAGGSFRIPMAAAVSASNFTFGDIDTDASNDWTVAQVGTDVVFTATASNPLEWNTIYNFGFDADRAPGAGGVVLGEHRPGAGAATVTVNAEVPGGVILAAFDVFGEGCEGSVGVPGGAAQDLNGAGGTLTGNTNQYEYTYAVNSAGLIEVVSFDIFTESSSGTITRPAHIYAANGSGPSNTPLASTTITVAATPGFYTATFASPVVVDGNFYVGYENGNAAVISNLTAGTSGVGYYRTAVTGNFQQSGIVDFPSYTINWNPVTVYETPVMGISGAPELGTTYNPTVSGALHNTFAILVSGLSSPGVVPLPGAPGCNLLTSTEALDLAITDASGNSNSPIVVPNTTALEGVNIYHQWAIWDPTVNNLGIIMSNGAIATLGN
tara:strand:+ start:28073 stop:30133 length:2061 start_codon:yes stop_codon:yes gene_type:complete